VLHHELAQLAALNLEASPKGLIQTPEALCGGVQHRHGIED
jgi:hypothetical protein